MYKLYINILILQLFSFLGGPQIGGDIIPPPGRSVLTEVPVIKLNFYLMGKDKVDDHIAEQIINNVDYMNGEFEGRVKFVVELMVTSLYTADLPVLKDDYVQADGGMIDFLINPVEKIGGVNVFLFDTYFEEKRGGSLMGFTPIMTARQQIYKQASPMFDRIFMAYHGLETRTTLIHEMGHFLGLSHPWELDAINKDLMGLSEADVEEHNHMGYHPEVNSFTFEQLERMRHFALTFRSYLLKRTEYFYMEDLYASLTN